MKFQVALMSAAVLALGIAGASAQGADPKHVITGAAAKAIGEYGQINDATAKAIANACERMAKEKGQGVAIFILDKSGNVVHMHRMDEAARYTAVYTAELKARTALKTMRPTSTRQYDVEANPQSMSREVAMGYFPTAGGMPIWSKDTIIGYLGVGGMNPTADWSDEICGYRALTEVVGPQPPMPQRPAPRPAAAR
jgi:glc operon protein GlcG